jgi:hypothetical protein
VAAAACRAAGISTRSIYPFPWWCVRLAVHTPLDEAVARCHDWSAGNAKADGVIESKMKASGQHS